MQLFMQSSYEPTFQQKQTLIPRIAHEQMAKTKGRRIGCYDGAGEQEMFVRYAYSIYAPHVGLGDNPNMVKLAPIIILYTISVHIYRG